MVYFTCNVCGESIKKPSVEKHFNTRCRNSPKNVSCMDCQKDFHGEEYVAHTKCISEAEKYSGKNYAAKENQNKGQKKQENWINIVRSILKSTEYQLSVQTRNIFQRLETYENVPRKKAKFQNFVANCLRIPANQAKPVWDVLEKELDNMKKVKQSVVACEDLKTNKESDNQRNVLKRTHEDKMEEEKTVSKKKKGNENESKVVTNGETAIADETEGFQWTDILGKIAAKHPDGLSLDKLKKKFLKKYKNKLNLEEDLNEKQNKKFEKKFSKIVKKCPAIKVDGETAKPC